MLDPYWLQLVVKTLCAALLVVAATIAVERSGPFWGALIASLPVSAGPIYVMLALEHDPGFIAASALSSLAAGIVTAVYMLVLALMGPTAPLLLTLAVGLLMWGALAFGLRPLPWTMATAGAAAIAANLIAMALTRQHRGRPIAAAAAPRWYDIPARALLVAGLAALVTSISHMIGPQFTGFAAVYPIVMTSIAIVVYMRMGGEAVGVVMANSFLPMVGFSLCLMAVILTVPHYGTWLGLLAGLGGSLGWSVVLAAVRLTRRGR